MTKEQGTIRNIWMLAREYSGLAGAGGVKDVVKQLAGTLAGWSGRRVSVVLPLYGFIQAQEQGFLPLEDPLQPGVNLEYAVNMPYVDIERQETVGVWYRKLGRVHVYLLAAERFREKADVYTYTPAEEAQESWKKQDA